MLPYANIKGPLVQRGLREAVGDCDLAHTSTCPRKVTIPPPLRGTSLV